VEADVSMSEEPELEESALSGRITSGKRTVDVQIYRLVGEPEWMLEIVDEYNNSTVWDSTFSSESAALVEAKKAILEETISAFVGPADGKSSGAWR
jgi:hypothetical protein